MINTFTNYPNKQSIDELLNSHIHNKRILKPTNLKLKQVNNQYFVLSCNAYQKNNYGYKKVLHPHAFTEQEKNSLAALTNYFNLYFIYGIDSKKNTCYEVIELITGLSLLRIYADEQYNRNDLVFRAAQFFSQTAANEVYYMLYACKVV